MGDLYGPIIGQPQVEQAVLNLLQGIPSGGALPLTVYYLAEIERQNGLQPKTLDQPATYRGGVDFLNWRTDLSPLIIVIARAKGDPTRLDPTQYQQLFEVQIAAILKAEDEDHARRFAGWYGAAIMKLVVDHGSIGPNPYDPTLKFGTHTELTGFPMPEFAVDDTTSRNIMRSVVTFETLIAPIVLQGGPVSYTTPAYTPPGDWPTVDTVDVTVTAQPLS